METMQRYVKEAGAHYHLSKQCKAHYHIIKKAVHIITYQNNAEPCERGRIRELIIEIIPVKKGKAWSTERYSEKC